MKVFICGQKSFGRAVLKRLYNDGHEIVGVAPPPQERYKDKMVGFAALKGIPVVSDCDMLTAADVPGDTELVISAHSHWMVSEKILEKCKYGGIGFHPSLLPRHRGQDAIRWAVHMGDFVTGATIYNLSGTVCDAGDILLQEVVFIDKGWDYHDLWSYMFPIGVRMVSEAVKLIENGGCNWRKQDEAFATFEPSWERPRLKRNDLILIGSPETVADECDGCSRGCGSCVYNIADPERYHKRVAV